MANSASVRAMLTQYTALGAEKRIQQWTLRLLHVGQFSLALALVWGLCVLGLGPWLGSPIRQAAGPFVVGLVAAAALMIGALNLMMSGAVYQALVLSRMQAKIEESVNIAVGQTAMSWEHAEVPKLYYTNMGRANYLYRADRIVFPLITLIQIIGTLAAAGYLQQAQGWALAAGLVVLSTLLISQSMVAAKGLLRLARTAHRLEDFRQP